MVQSVLDDIFYVRVMTAITDAGLVHLKELTSLQGLDLQDTQITDAGVAYLKEILPQIDVY